MPKVTFIHFSGSQRTVDVPTGWTLMEAAVQNGVDGITAECGGGCACATCHVLVEPEWMGKVPAIRPSENDLLECTVVTRCPQSRLSCQIQVSEDLDGLTVRLPERQT